MKFGLIHIGEPRRPPSVSPALGPPLTSLIIIADDRTQISPVKNITHITGEKPDNNLED
jgi:hypothetical protein